MFTFSTFILFIFELPDKRIGERQFWCHQSSSPVSSTFGFSIHHALTASLGFPFMFFPPLSLSIKTTIEAFSLSICPIHSPFFWVHATFPISMFICCAQIFSYHHFSFFLFNLNPFFVQDFTAISRFPSRYASLPANIALSPANVKMLYMFLPMLIRLTSITFIYSLVVQTEQEPTANVTFPCWRH